MIRKRDTPIHFLYLAKKGMSITLCYNIITKRSRSVARGAFPHYKLRKTGKGKERLFMNWGAIIAVIIYELATIIIVSTVIARKNKKRGGEETGGFAFAGGGCPHPWWESRWL